MLYQSVSLTSYFCPIPKIKFIETLDACIIFVLFYQAFVDRHGWTSSARNKSHPNSRKVSRLGEYQTSPSLALVVHSEADLQEIELSVCVSVTPC